MAGGDDVFLLQGLNLEKLSDHTDGLNREVIVIGGYTVYVYYVCIFALLRQTENTSVNKSILADS